MEGDRLHRREERAGAELVHGEPVADDVGRREGRRHLRGRAPVVVHGVIDSRHRPRGRGTQDAGVRASPFSGCREPVMLHGHVGQQV